jgi:alpha-1,4-galacturonosyltransferase
MNKHFAASSVPKGINCLSLRLTDEYSSNAHARKQLPPPELLPMLSDNSYHHFILSTDNILAASVVVASTVQSSQKPENIVFHVITDKKTYAGMHSWFALNPPSPAIVEVKGIHQFDWLTRENVPVLEAVESQNAIRDYYHGNHVIGANLSDISPRKFASKLQARSPKYISLLNHIRIYIPEVSWFHQQSTHSFCIVSPYVPPFPLLWNIVETFQTIVSLFFIIYLLIK